jgi:hypothetical protein
VFLIPTWEKRIMGLTHILILEKLEHSVGEGLME